MCLSISTTRVIALIHWLTTWSPHLTQVPQTAPSVQYELRVFVQDRLSKHGG